MGTDTNGVPMKILVVALCLTLTGCAVMDEITPVTQGEAERMQAAQLADTQAAIDAAESGMPLEAIGSGLGALVAAILLSRRRRANQLAADRLKKAGGAPV